MSAVMPNEVFSQSDLEILQRSPQVTSYNKSAADPIIKSSPFIATQDRPTEIEAIDVADSSEEFTLAEDCTQPLISITETPSASSISELSRERTDESISDGNASPELQRNDYSGQSTGFLGCLRDWVIKIRNSKLMLVVLFLLLAMPISAGYMSSRYMDSCPMNKQLPVFVFIMAIAGMILIFSRMITLGVRLFRCFDEGTYEQIAVTGTSAFLIAFFFIIEILLLYLSKPVFNNPVSKDYCDEVFYYYVFYMNFALIGITIIATLLHIPKRGPSPAVIEVHYD